MLGLVVHEGDVMASEPGPRLCVDKGRAGLSESLDSVGDVGNLERDVVHAGPSPTEEAPDRRV